MKLVLATSNRGKIKEIKALFGEDYEIIPYSDVINIGEIVEDGATFAENAMIKARAVYKAMQDPDVVVMSDDSGISVEALDNEPGIYSARYAGEDANDQDNLQKLVQALQAKSVVRSRAFYTAAISIVSAMGEYTVHGWMHGMVVTEPRGNGGFGYDPMFVPEGYELTLGELDMAVKKRMSHRAKALHKARSVLNLLKKCRIEFGK